MAMTFTREEWNILRLLRDGDRSLSELDPNGFSTLNQLWERGLVRPYWINQFTRRKRMFWHIQPDAARLVAD